VTQINRCSYQKEYLHFKFGVRRFSSHNSQTAGPIIKVDTALDSEEQNTSRKVCHNVHVRSKVTRSTDVLIKPNCKIGFKQFSGFYSQTVGPIIKVDTASDSGGQNTSRKVCRNVHVRSKVTKPIDVLIS
jgi:hypothetical protein